MVKEAFVESRGNNIYHVKLAKAFYEREAVFHAAYKFQDRFYIRIEPVEEGYVGVWFERKENTEFDAEVALKEFCNEVLDQQVRLDLDKRYGTLREAIYEQAFRPIRKAGK